MKRFNRLTLVPVLFFLIPAFSAAEPLPTDVTILTKKDFVGRPYYTVADALNETGFVEIQKDGYNGTRAIARMRGLSNSNQVAVLIDGQSINHEFDGQVDLNQIPINIVERIEITRGGGSVRLQTEAAGGVINIVTIRPEQKEVAARVGTGVGRDGAKHSHLQLTGRSYLGDFTYLGSRQTSGGFMTNEDHFNQNHFVNLTRSFNGKGYWGLEYFYQESEVGQGKGTLIPFSEWDGRVEHISADPLSLEKEKNQHAKVYLASPETSKGTFYLTMAFNNRTSDLFPDDHGPSLRNADNRSVSGDLRWKWHGLEAGAERTSMKREIFPLRVNKAYRNSFYAFHASSTSHWTVVPGFRVNDHSVAGGAVDPRLALVFRPNDLLSFSGTAQTAHRYPNFEELFFSSGITTNQELHAERAVSSDLGVTLTPAPAISLSATSFQTRVKDRILPNGANQLQNGGQEKTQGLETQLTIRYGEGTRYSNLRLRTDWTFQSSRLNGLAAPLMPRQFGAITLDWYLPRKVTLTNELRYQSEQFELAGRQGLRVPSYSIWNARFNIKIWSADLYLQGNNLNRHRYADTIAIYTPTSGTAQTLLAPQAELSVWAGISIRFLN